MKVYVDAGTKNNGKRGFQVTTICVMSETQEVLFEKKIGDYTNNEGEILAIIAALKNVHPEESKEIYSDSQIAVNWTIRGTGKKRNKKGKKRLSERLLNFIDMANMLLSLSSSTIIWTPRENNKAGWYLEEKYKI